jgi:peptide chain release factor 1
MLCMHPLPHTQPKLLLHWTHPSCVAGTAVSIQDERSQHKNKAKALKVLRAHLFKVQQEKQQAMTSASKMQLAGSGDRSERIRTYNFPQGRVTDHRVGHTEHGVERVLAGEALDAFIDKLQGHHAHLKLQSLGAK